MFDVGFLELAVIMVLGLLVLGPERLPKAAQTIGYWFGKARRYVEGMKSQVEAEFDSSEVKRLLRNQEVQIRELQSRLTDTGDQVNKEYTNIYDDPVDDSGDEENPHVNHEADSLEMHQAESSSSQSSVAQSDVDPVANPGPKYDIIEDDDGGWGGSDDENSSTINENTLAEEQPLDKAQ